MKKRLFIIPLLFLIFIITGCTKDVNKVINVDLTDYKDSFNYSMNSSQVCVIDNDQNSRYSGTIYKKVGHEYFVATPYASNDSSYVPYDLSVAYNGKEVDATFIGYNDTNAITVLKFSTSDELAVAKKSSLEVTKGMHEYVCSTLEYSSKTDNNMYSISKGFVSNIINTRFMIENRLTQTSTGSAVFDKDGGMLGYVYTVLYSDNNNLVDKLSLCYYYDYFLDICSKVEETGNKYPRAYIGMTTTAILALMVRNGKIYNLPLGYSNSVVVSEVLAPSTARSAGIKVNDIVIEMNGIKITSNLDLTQASSLKRSGEEGVIKVLRPSDYKFDENTSYEELTINFVY